MLHCFMKRLNFLYPKLPSRTADDVVEGLLVTAVAAAVAVVAMDGVVGGGCDEGEDVTAVENMVVYGGLIEEARNGSELWKRAKY